MHHFIITIRHGGRMINIHTTASSEAAARHIVMEAERCPAHTIRKVRAHDENDVELDLKHLPKYRVLRVPGADVRVTEFPGYRINARKVPTRYEVHVENRWRRVFTTAHTSLRYVVLDGLNVMVDLPGDLT